MLLRTAIYIAVFSAEPPVKNEQWLIVLQKQDPYSEVCADYVYQTHTKSDMIYGLNITQAFWRH